MKGVEQLKKLLLVYNPYSGSQGFKFDLDVCIRIFQKEGYFVSLFRLDEDSNLELFFEQSTEEYTCIVASGGDGTVNGVVTAMMHSNSKASLGIIPAGTANDFASYLYAKTNNLEECCSFIATTTPRFVDIGSVNGRYFVNVCGGGLLARVSQEIDHSFKNQFGTLAYYIKGIEQIPNFTPIPVRITTTTEVREENIYLFLVMNSPGAGNFDHLAPLASISDGMFDFIGIRAKPVYELAVLFLKILRGEHIDDSNVIYLRDRFFRIEDLSGGQMLGTNIDGESGPDMPVEIQVIHNALRVHGNFML